MRLSIVRSILVFACVLAVLAPARSATCEDLKKVAERLLRSRRAAKIHIDDKKNGRLTVDAWLATTCASRSRALCAPLTTRRAEALMKELQSEVE